VSSYSDSRCCPFVRTSACRRGADPRGTGRGRIGHRGIRAGVASVVAGFLGLRLRLHTALQDPRCRHAQNWTALAVYRNRHVGRGERRRESGFIANRGEAGQRAAHRLSELSEHLVGDRPVDDLLKTIVSAVHVVFEVPGVSMLVLDEGF